MHAWQAVRTGDGHVETIDRYESPDAAVADLTATAWESPDNSWLNYVTDEAGLVVATAIFGPEGELLVTMSDGRRMEVPMPESYREFFAAGGEGP